jgi:hypothetical protein
MRSDQDLLNEDGAAPCASPPITIVETNSVELPDWTVRLRGLDEEEELEFEDGGSRQRYLFKEVLDPDENPTGLFNVFCKDQNFVDINGDPFWITLNGLVSKSKYVVVKMDKFIKELLQTIPFSDTGARIKHQPFMISWEKETTNEIEFFDDDDAKLVFGIVTAMDSPEITSMKSVTSIHCINSYSGKRALNIDFIIKTSANVNGVSITLKDYFTLTRRKINITHTRRLEDLQTELGAVQEHAKEVICELKDFKDPEKINQIVNDITNRFLMDAKKEFSSLCENLIGDFRNLFFVLTIASYCLDKYYDITRHVDINSYVDKTLKTILG